MSPTTIVHVILPVIIFEHKLINRLCPINDLINQRLTQGIFKRTSRTIRRSYANSSQFIIILDIICTEKEIVLPIRMKYRRCPKSTPKPTDILFRKYLRMLLPMYQISRRKSIHKNLLIVTCRICGINPIFIIKDHSFRVSIPAFKKGISTFFIL